MSFCLRLRLVFSQCVYMFFDRAPVNPFSRALSCGFSTELLLAYRALGGCHGNMVLCVLLTRASYRNKVPSTICTASALSSTLRGSSIDGTFKVRSVAFVHFENLQSELFSLSWNTAMATSVINRERGVGNKWGLRCDNGKRLLMGRLWLLPTGSAAVKSDFKGPHLLSVACFLDACVKYVPWIY